MLRGRDSKCCEMDFQFKMFEWTMSFHQLGMVQKNLIPGSHPNVTLPYLDRCRPTGGLATPSMVTFQP